MDWVVGTTCKAMSSQMRKQHLPNGALYRDTSCVTGEFGNSDRGGREEATTKARATRACRRTRCKRVQPAKAETIWIWTQRLGMRRGTVAGFRARKSNEEREAQRRSRTGRLENGARARAGPEEAFLGFLYLLITTFRPTRRVLVTK